MLNKSKLERVVAKMKEQDMPQMIITDPVSIFYMLDKWIIPGERMLALYINVNGDVQLVLNKLFPQTEDLGVPLTYYDDIEEPVGIPSAIVLAISGEQRSEIPLHTSEGILISPSLSTYSKSFSEPVGANSFGPHPYRYASPPAFLGRVQHSGAASPIQ